MSQSHRPRQAGAGGGAGRGSEGASTTKVTDPAQKALSRGFRSQRGSFAAHLGMGCLQ